MTTEPNRSPSGLRWIRREIDENLRQARLLLEDFAEGEITSLGEAIHALHQVRGALMVAQVYGGAMLADELELLARELDRDGVNDPEEAAETLMVGIAQLPAYLERVERGQSDVPLILLPLLNELRAASGAPVVSETSLFAPQLEAQLATEPVLPGSGNPDLPRVAKRLRPQYHAALLKWLRASDIAAAKAAMNTLRTLVDQLSSQSGTSRMRRLLDAVDALLLAIASGDVEGIPAVKRLYGRLDRVIKDVITLGEEAVASEFPVALYRDLLYYIARANSNDPVIEAVRRVADLANSFSEVKSDDVSSGQVGMESRALFRTVADAIAMDLAAIKEQLDIYMRGERTELDRIGALVDPLRRLADTLGMVGQGRLRERLMPHVDALVAAVSAKTPPDEDRLVAIAWDLLAVESALLSLGEEKPNAEEAEASAGGAPDMSEGDYREHVRAVLDQALIEFAHVRESLAEYLSGGDVDVLRRTPQRLRELTGVLAVIEQGQVAGLLRSLGCLVGDLVAQHRDFPDEAAQERLGDLVSGVEVYLSSLLDPSPDTPRALALAGDAAEALGLSTASETAEVGALEGVAEAGREMAQGADDDEPGQRDRAPEEITRPPAPQAEPAESSSGEVAGEAISELDSDILPIFIEEAREVLETLREQTPRWTNDLEDADALARVRRAYHTLKGSGRLVGALEIAEFAWSLENMLNRVIDGTVTPSPSLVALLDETLGVLSELVDAREQGRAPGIDTAPLRQRADTLAAGEIPIVEEEEQESSPPQQAESASATERESMEERAADSSAAAGPEASGAGEPELEIEAGELEETLLPVSDESLPPDEETQPLVLVFDEEDESESATSRLLDSQLLEASSLHEDESILTPASEDPAPIRLDPTLHQIFAREAEGHLQVLEAFIEHCRGLANGCVYDEEVRRALHTLRGSANMAEIESIAALAGALERWSNLLATFGRRTDQAGIDLLERGHFVLRSLLGVINVGGGVMPSWQPLVKEVEAASRILEEEVAQEEHVESTSRAEETGDFDAELVAVFVEEARELLDAIETSFDTWRSRPDDLLPIAQLQRSLHTLKGGARLAGLAAIGDLGHGLESLFESAVEQHIQPEAALLELCRHAIDRLAAQVEAAEQGRQARQELELLEAIAAAARGESWDLPDVAGEERDGSAQDERFDVPLEVPEDRSELSGDVELETVEQSVSGLPHSTLLTESQLLTDSELLAESDLTATTSALVPGDGDASGLRVESRIIQFPTRGRNEESPEEEELRKPPPPPEEEKPTVSRERVRVAGQLLDQMVNHAGEVSIYGARLDQQNRILDRNIEELMQTIGRLRTQLRQLESETEAQILARHEREHEGSLPAGFDPLEMDRYSTIQQLSRALAETTEDLANLGGTLQDVNRDTETLLQQQDRVVNDLQEGLLRTRMVPVGSRASRLQRVVRQTAHGLGKQAELTIVGAAGEMDRVILERMMGPLEHLFRNAVVHGIESPEERQAAGKPPVGKVTMTFGREGSDVLLQVSDDGRGLDREAIRRKAVERGLIDADAHVSGEDLDAFILEVGLSTSEEVTQVAGRGVGMDVVVNEIKQLGGSLAIDSTPGSGTRFTIRLPFTLAISEALLVGVQEEVYAVPHGSMQGIARISRYELEACYRGEQDSFSHGGEEYPVRYLGLLLGASRPQLPEGERWFPVMLVRSGEHRLAIQVDRLIGNRQIVVKSVGAQLAGVRWFTGGTILADGSIALILDVGALVRMDSAHYLSAESEQAPLSDTGGVKVMVVDDSITVRKVTSRLLERHNMQVVTARDGVDAVALLQEERPDVMLLDIEMPRMDGFELARHMRSTEGLKDVPIIMITSRTGDKHREHALELGVRRYLGKPYQESELLENIYTVLAEVTP